MLSPRFVLLSAASGLLALIRLTAAPVHLVDEAPVAITRVAPDVILVDFGRVAFGNLRLTPPDDTHTTLTVHFGEAFADGRVLRTPPGTVRYATTTVALNGQNSVVAAPAPDARNTRQVTADTKPDRYGYIAPPAVLTPPEWGVVLPFRWVEIEGWTGELRPEHLRRQSAFASTWDDTAAFFKSSNPDLDRIWELCRYSIKATTFAGVYVDGDRERIPYEADAYLNQISHYYTDYDVQTARDTFDHLMAYPTWPTEWASHMIFMAHADWMHTGDTTWLASRYESLKKKLLLERAREDGLITSTEAQIKQGDLVDWPVGERDGFVFTPVNTVVNAVHVRCLALMADLARALDRDAEADEFLVRERRVRTAFQTVLYDATRGVYRDGEGTDHASQHANLFPLAFGLVPASEHSRVTDYVKSRGMACSVYVAQYLLEALFEHDPAAALALTIAPGDRSWLHMVNSGTTITWEAWEMHYKKNQDWNHAWGAAPANLFPRYLLGVSARTPGWSEATIRPHPVDLTHASGKVPTPLGAILVNWENTSTFKLTVELPAHVRAHLDLPAPAASRGVFADGEPLAAKRVGDRWIVASPVTGRATFEVK
jgi:alpha-L-rhamnosidase